VGPIRCRDPEAASPLHVTEFAAAEMVVPVDPVFSLLVLQMDAVLVEGSENLAGVAKVLGLFAL